MEKKFDKSSLWRLYSAFFRIGAFTFGGGYAMLPMLERECVDKTGWADREELLDYFAIGQCTPGVIAVNTATFIGSKQGGLLGAAAATLGVVTPSVIIIVAIAALLSNFAHIPAVQHAFGGVRVAVGVLILNAVVQLFRNNVVSAPRKWMSIGICLLSLLGMVFFKPSPVLVVLCAGLVGLGFGKWGKE